MSPDDASISRAAPADVAQDYDALLAEGTRLLQALTGKVWTNYNHSDPGVTVLQQLCYALTELGYRADFGVADLLGAPGTGQITLTRQGLYPARAIMSSNAVTPGDLRRLVLDRVPEVGNAWFTPLSPEAAGGTSGLYRLDVLARSEPCECDPPDTQALRKRVLDCYTAHRALCEDVQECRSLDPLAARVGADVYLTDGTDPDQALARLQFALGMLFAPEPRRQSLEQRLALGLTTAEIFDGPPMLHGFIGDDQLGALPRTLALDDLLDTMAGVQGVLAVDDLTLLVGADPHLYRPGDQYALPDGAVLSLQTVARGAGPVLRLFAAGLPCRTKPDKVARLLAVAWAEQRRTFALAAACREHYATPKGRGQDLTSYISVQQQFPSVYGIGAYGLPSEADATRRAQARQLKGYLMPFDQLMADGFSQLGFVRDLFSIDTGGARSYAWQSLAPLVPDSEPLLMPGYEEEMAALVAANDPARARQGAVLDFLLSLYGEQLQAPAPDIDIVDARTRAAWEARVLEAKRTLLTRTVAATRERGRGFDYRRAAGARNVAGMEIRCRIELGLDDAGIGAGDRGDGEDAAAFDEAATSTQPLYIVEWLLLRYALEDGHPPGPGADMGARICAVLPQRRIDDGVDDASGDDDSDDGDEDGDQDAEWRSRARAILRANTPAHIIVDTLFLDRGRMRSFVGLYEDWTRALRGGSAARRRESSQRLARFLRPQGLPPASTLAVERPPALPAPVPSEVLALPATLEPPHAPTRQAAAGADHPGNTLPGRVHAASPGANGLHVHASVDAARARHYATLGYRFLLRDLATHLGERQGLDRDEAVAILEVGLALMAVQSTPFIGWIPGAEHGQRDGLRAVAQARLIGLPAGVTLWLHPPDPVPVGVSLVQLSAYCAAWRDAVDGAGYQAGLYVPHMDLLDARALARLSFACYWRRHACRASLTGRGACLVRMAGHPQRIDGEPCDRHYVEADHRGDTPTWLQPS